MLNILRFHHGVEGEGRSSFTYQLASIPEIRPLLTVGTIYNGSNEHKSAFEAIRSGPSCNHILQRVA